MLCGPFTPKRVPNAALPKAQWDLPGYREKGLHPEDGWELNRLYRERSRSQGRQSSRSVWTIRHRVGLLSFAGGLGVGLDVLMGPFHIRMFYNSMNRDKAQGGIGKVMLNPVPCQPSLWVLLASVWGKIPNSLLLPGLVLSWAVRG